MSSGDHQITICPDQADDTGYQIVICPSQDEEDGKQIVICNREGEDDPCDSAEELTLTGADELESTSDYEQYSAAGGVAPYSYSFDGGSIDSTGLITAITSCGGSRGNGAVGRVTVTDACGSSASIDIRLPGGSWSQESYNVPATTGRYFYIETISGSVKTRSYYTYSGTECAGTIEPYNDIGNCYTTDDYDYACDGYGSKGSYVMGDDEDCEICDATPGLPNAYDMTGYVGKSSLAGACRRTANNRYIGWYEYSLSSSYSVIWEWVCS
jgi:hypothetical protein